MRSIRTAALFSLPLALAALAVPAHADVKDGVDAWQAGDYQAAVAEWRPLALVGDPDAQFNLGQAYKLGRGVPADLAQAEAWYRRAAKQGHLQAEDNLGLVLFTANRRDEAMDYIARSAARGEPRAQYVLGTAHFNGDLATRDWPLSYALTKRATDAGLDIAAARLAQLDRLIPLEQRQRGLAMLPDMEKSEARARLAAVNAAAPPPSKPASSLVKTAQLPASIPAASYTPPPVIAAAKPPAPAAVPDTPATIVTPTPAPALSPAAQAAADAANEATAAATAAAGTSFDAPPEKAPATSAPAMPVKTAVAPAPEQPAPVKATAPQPVPTKAAESPWRAQLGAFGVEANARNLWSTLAKKHPAVAARKPYFVKTGTLTRLHAGGFANKGAADGFCATMAASGQPCLVVDK